VTATKGKASCGSSSRALEKRVKAKAIHVMKKKQNESNGHRRKCIGFPFSCENLLKPPISPHPVCCFERVKRGRRKSSKGREKKEGKKGKRRVSLMMNRGKEASNFDSLCECESVSEWCTLDFHGCGQTCALGVYNIYMHLFFL
jgi:hypothetical protein